MYLAMMHAGAGQVLAGTQEGPRYLADESAERCKMPCGRQAEKLLGFGGGLESCPKRAIIDQGPYIRHRPELDSRAHHRATGRPTAGPTAT